MLSNKLFKQRFFSLFFSSKGRISRGLFWKSNFLWLFGVGGFSLILIIIKELDFISNDTLGFCGLILYGIFYYGIMILTIKRLHDFNWSGWLALPSLLILIPFLIIGILTGTSGQNKYGENSEEYEKWKQL